MFGCYFPILKLVYIKTLVNKFEFTAHVSAKLRVTIINTINKNTGKDRLDISRCSFLRSEGFIVLDGNG